MARKHSPRSSHTLCTVLIVAHRGHPRRIPASERSPEVTELARRLLLTYDARTALSLLATRLHTCIHHMLRSQKCLTLGPSGRAPASELIPPFSVSAGPGGWGM